MTIINGTEIAKEILERLKKEPQPKKFLAAVLVGNDPASASFIRQKERVGEELGVDFRLHNFPTEITEVELKDEILKVSSEENCGAVLIQLPLPKHIDRQHILNCVPKEKDVDVLGEEATQAFYQEKNAIHPPAVAVVEEIVERLKINLTSATVAVIGVGLLVGKPISIFLEKNVSQLSVLHRSSGDVRTQLRDSNLIVSGTGRAHLFSANDLGSGAVVIDFGYGDLNGKMAGDFDSTEGEGSEVAYTPTPGGTGPILVAKLYENFYKLNML